MIDIHCTSYSVRAQRIRARRTGSCAAQEDPPCWVLGLEVILYPCNLMRPKHWSTLRQGTFDCATPSIGSNWRLAHWLGYRLPIAIPRRLKNVLCSALRPVHTGRRLWLTSLSFVLEGSKISSVRFYFPPSCTLNHLTEFGPCP